MASIADRLERLAALDAEIVATRKAFESSRCNGLGSAVEVEEPTMAGETSVTASGSEGGSVCSVAGPHLSPN